MISRLHSKISMTLIDPLKTFGPKLNSVQSPSRYIGGEYGITIKPHTQNDSNFNFVTAFPDLYEIAMSNLAIKIIYNGLNAIDGIRCERVFAPDIDFENLLKETDTPLYTLETGMPLNQVDMVGFSIGYELGITEVLAMLETGKIHLLAEERTEDEPIVICGGCGVTNPAPTSDFFDAFVIGEAEPALFNLVKELRDLKKSGAKRKDLLACIESKPFVWTKNKTTTARRAVQNNFGLVPSVPSWFPLPTNKPVQDHGVVEIMRGCPNGCRFCHAGIYYRPMRVKALNLIIEEVDHLVFDAGYREVSLNSLSSADFPDVAGLLDIMNERYKGYNVSFQLPSLKVNSLSLDLLEKLSTVRKSGLTFAVETPDEMSQLSLNKEVYSKHLEEIILEAKKRGWSTAKFYFMIGLPLEIEEEKAIVDFMLDLQKKTRIQCNVNVGVYIPKPHTAYERVKQIDIETAKRKIDYLYENLPRGKFKLGRHNFNATVLEGLLSRGDNRAGKIILNAYKKGARFDAWDDYLRKDYNLWEEAFKEADYNVMEWIYRDWSNDKELPWSGVSLGVAPNFYKKEMEKSRLHEMTPRCSENCTHRCGICNSKEDVKVYEKDTVEAVSRTVTPKSVTTPEEHDASNIPVLYRVLFNFTRINGGEFIPYLSQVEIFHKAMLRSNLQFVFTAGFNPLPRLEFATAITLGLPSLQETASCLLYENISTNDFIEKMNRALPGNLHITDAMIFPVTNLRKRESLTTGLWGSVYRYSFLNEKTEKDFLESTICKETCEKSKYSLAAKDGTYELKAPVSDKKFRMAIEEFSGRKWFEEVEVTKIKTLAIPEIQGWTAEDEDKWRRDNKNFSKTEIRKVSEEPVEFMELYKYIAKINEDLISKRSELTKLAKEIQAEKEKAEKNKLQDITEKN